MSDSSDSPRCLRTVDVGAYLLGGMDAAERALFAGHVEGCRHCQAAVHELQPLIQHMASLDLSTIATSPDHPSPGLRDRLLAAAAAESGDGAGSVVDLSDRVARTHGASPAVDRVDAAHGSGVVSPLRPRRHLPVRAAAAVAVAFAVGAGGGYSVRPAAQSAPPPTTVKSQNWEEPNIPGYSDAPGQRVQFVGGSGTGQSDVKPEGFVMVNVGPAGTYAALHTKKLRVGERYSWWFERIDGTRISLGSFTFPGNLKGWLVCPGSTSVERVELKAVGATDASGVDILRADLPAVPA
jgi:hypothetical protein